MYPEFPHLNQFISYRIRPLRSLRRWLISRGIGYVVFNSNEEDFWITASKHIPYFSLPLSVKAVDKTLGSWSPWVVLREQIEADDKVFPFAINVDTMAMRLGYVVLRKGKPLGGICTVSS